MQQQKPNAAKNKINKINKFIYKKRYGPFNKRYAKLNNNEMPYFKKKFLHSVDQETYSSIAQGDQLSAL